MGRKGGGEGKPHVHTGTTWIEVAGEGVFIWLGMGAKGGCKRQQPHVGEINSRGCKSPCMTEGDFGVEWTKWGSAKKGEGRPNC